MAVTLMLLSACVSRTAPPDSTADFRITGKMAIRGVSGNVSARFIWSQSAERYDLELWGPFGTGRRRLAGDSQTVRLLDGSGDLLLAGPVRDVMRSELGWELPLDALRHWIRGRPDPTQRLANMDRNDAGEALRIDQGNWQISYSEYAPTASGARLPRRLTAIGEGYQIRLAINRWEV